jgi:antitoxin component YwqK of YwqJK toxin-antitoxin module
MANLGLLTFVATNEGDIKTEVYDNKILYESKKEVLSLAFTNDSEIFCTKNKTTKKGICKEYYNGLEKFSYTHKNTLKDGPFLELYEETEGVKFVVNCQNDTFNGEAKYYREDGYLKSVGVYYNGKSQGPCSIYDKSGVKIRDVYYNQNIPYLVSDFYPNGSLKCTYDVKNGKANGMFMSFYPNGQLNLKVPYENDKPHGLEESYTQDGHLISEINFYEGIRHGSCTYYDSNGDLVDIYIYSNGEPVRFF